MLQQPIHLQRLYKVTQKEFIDKEILKYHSSEPRMLFEQDGHTYITNSRLFEYRNGLRHGKAVGTIIDEKFNTITYQITYQRGFMFKDRIYGETNLAQL